MIIYLAREAQIDLLSIEKVIDPTKYADFADFFSMKFAK